MANRNDYNYYKNEYGKYKANYYSPGSEEYKKRQSGSRKQKAARFFRAFFVFIIIAALVVGVVWGIVKLASSVNGKVNENTTVSTTLENKTTKENKTTDKTSKYKKGTKCIVKTEEGTGVNLRSKPSYDVKGYQLVEDGAEVVIEKLSSDGKWCKTSNFENNGWLNLKYLKVVEKESKTEKVTEKTTEKQTKKETTTKKPETTTEPKTQSDGSIKSYSDAVKAFESKASGTVMNCKIVGSGNIYATYTSDPSSARILLLLSGDRVQVIQVNGSYSKIIKDGYKAWVANENLSFVSWG